MWLRSLVEGPEALEEIPVHRNRDVVLTERLGQITYRLELVRCSKDRCKCAGGKLHGPHWYCYQRQGDKMTSAYVGKDRKGDRA